ncbi:MAG: hypothetical protein XXXJIFNMEKO3_00441 [Candidatus Erwinia impunctatus]|nr:hypothetical protein XXXJIFNMEKO_00441 [Culicoides impunctatus]
MPHSMYTPTSDSNAAQSWDYILVGGGLANSLIACYLLEKHPQFNLLLLEAEAEIGGNHTWSFHQSDLTDKQMHWISPFIAHQWQGYDVSFPGFTRTLPGRYLSITSEKLATTVASKLGSRLRCNSKVAVLTSNYVELINGERLTARAVIDGRGYQPDPSVQVGHQAFLGQEWQLRHPHQLLRPLLMDATVSQRFGYRFVYVLPLSAYSLLIEDTQYINDAHFSREQARADIATYATEQGWERVSLIREEQGCLPITLSGCPESFWKTRKDQPCSGLRAGLYHPTTGYSLPLALTLAGLIAQHDLNGTVALATKIEHLARTLWRKQRFFRALNRMLFLAGSPTQRWQVMQRFYRLDEGLISRFYAGHPTITDKIRILAGSPPVPVYQALAALANYSPGQRGVS